MVTGAAQGIGAATARLLAANGVAVVVADWDEEQGTALAEEIGGTFLPLDVTDPEAWARVPSVDYAFLNAGTMSQATPCAPDDLQPSVWERVRGVNADGVVNGLLHLLPTMGRSGGGSIVLAGSLAGLASFPPDPFYAGTKALVISLARSIGGMASASGVRVNALCPGEVATRMLPADRADLLRSKGYEPLSPEAVAVAVVEILEHPESGNVWTLVSGRTKDIFTFPDVPRPLRSADGRGPRPPSNAASDAGRTPPNG